MMINAGWYNPYKFKRTEPPLFRLLSFREPTLDRSNPSAAIHRDVNSWLSLFEPNPSTTSIPLDAQIGLDVAHNFSIYVFDWYRVIAFTASKLAAECAIIL